MHQPLCLVLRQTSAWKHVSAALLLAGLSGLRRRQRRRHRGLSDPSYKGTVTAFAGPTNFSVVDGNLVDASGSNATPARPRKGSRVEIQGDMGRRAPVARRVELDNWRDDHNTDPHELGGRVTAYTSPTSFSIDGIPGRCQRHPHHPVTGHGGRSARHHSNGVMVADRLKVEDQSTGDRPDDSGDDVDTNGPDDLSAEREDDHSASGSHAEDDSTAMTTHATPAESGCEDDDKHH
ncbi:MAG: hypothetical protein R3E42_09515 [Burkholderiaceae bacterium]